MKWFIGKNSKKFVVAPATGRRGVTVYDELAAELPVPSFDDIDWPNPEVHDES